MSKNLDDLLEAIEGVVSEWAQGNILSTDPASSTVCGDDLLCMHRLMRAWTKYQVEDGLKEGPVDGD